MQWLTFYEYWLVKNVYINASITYVPQLKCVSISVPLMSPRMKCSKHTLLNSPAQSLDKTKAVPSMITISVEGIDRYDVHT